MCKIAIFTGLNYKDQETKEATIQLMAELGSIMSKGNSHGLGYAAIDSQGNMFGERWLENDDAFDKRPEDTGPITVFDKFKDVCEDFKVEKEIKYTSFGDVSDDFKSMLLHARFSTNTIHMLNTHPFYDEETSTALIHNGVIRNDTVKDHIRSNNCDSERILNKYIEYDIANNPDNMTKMMTELVGYAACGIYSKTSEGKLILDIFKSNNDNLSGVFVEELQTVVFSSDADDIKKACHIVGLTPIGSIKLKQNVLVRLDPFTGEIISTTKFKGMEQSSYSNTSSRYGSRYLGHTDFSDDDWDRNYLPKSTNENINSYLKEADNKLKERTSIDKAKDDGWVKCGVSGGWIKVK